MTLRRQPKLPSGQKRNEQISRASLFIEAFFGCSELFKLQVHAQTEQKKRQQTTAAQAGRREG